MKITSLLTLLPLLLTAETTYPMVFHKAPSPLSPNAVVEDWPRFSGLETIARVWKPLF